MNRNIRLMRQVADEFGGAVIGVSAGKNKHQKFTMVLPDGTILTHKVAQGLRNDEFKVKQWARQRIRQAMKAQNHNGSV